MFVDVGGRYVATSVLFTTTTHVAGGGDPLRIYIGLGDPFEIHVFDHQGTMNRIIRLLRPPVPIPQKEIEAARGRRLEFARRARRVPETRRLLDALPPQRTYPAHQRILVDTEGCLWVASSTEGWHVFDSRGRWLGALPLNDRLDRIFEIGFDYVLGVNSDELGIERVRIFALARSGFKACAN